MVETSKGKLVIPKSQKTIDHITLAGLEIALGDEALSFDEVYRRVSDNGKLETGMLQEIGQMIMARYEEDAESLVQ